MRDVDPRDFDSRDRDHSRPEPSRGGRTDAATRERDETSCDPRDVPMKNLDLPRGPERELVRVRGRTYELNGRQNRALSAVGAFRVVSARDLRDHLHLSGDARAGDLRHLRESGLIRTVPLEGYRDRVIALTEAGRNLLEAHRRTGGQEPRQVFYAGVRKPRELEHDTQIYRAYTGAAERLTDRGARLRRVVLDYELKSEYQRFLQAGNRSRADSDGRSDREAHEIAAWAFAHDLPYFDEQVHFPDVRIEYEDLDERSRHEDIEITTVHYRGAHAAAAARSGFSRYSSVSARVSARGGGGRGGGRRHDSRLAEELLL